MRVLVVLLLIFFLGCTTPAPNPPVANCSLDSSVDSYASLRAEDLPVIPEGWGTPKRLGFNTDCWEDSANISPDGKKLYFSQYTAVDLIADATKGQYSGKIIGYESEYPFDTVKKTTWVKEPFSIAGLNQAGDDFYYNSNETAGDGKNDTDIYRNFERLSFNDSEDDSDPHYCPATDELYFWSTREGNNFIYVYKDGARHKLPAPINSGLGDMQPFLTPDCQEMYFTSGRGNTGDGHRFFSIYHSTRLGEDSWSEPELFLFSSIGVAEPSMSDDGQSFFFVQLFRTPEQGFVMDVYSMEKTNQG